MSGESIFNDVESIYINNEEVQSIKRVDDGTIIYEKSMVLENPMVLTVTGSSFSTYSSTPFTYNDKVFVDWGDDTGLVEYNGGKLSHTFNDGLNFHTVKVYGDLTSLKDNCFYNCTGLTSITIPDSVINLEMGCFEECTGLTSITLPNNIISLENSCFYNCTSLNSITIPDNVTSLGESCFEGCNSLTSIAIPDNVTSLGDGCFYDCIGLTSITLSNNITSFGEGCFYHCVNLTSITLPNSVINLGTACFNSCTGLIDYYLNWTSLSTIIPYNSSKTPNNTNTIFHIPVGTKQLYIDKGYPSDKLEEPSVMILTVTGSTFSSSNSTPFTYNDKVFVDYGDGYGPFEYSGGKLSCYYSDGLNSHTVKVYGDITSLKDDCFMNWDNLTSITIPGSVTSLGSNCFQNCTGLTSITIPDSVTNLKDACFMGCDNLTSITIPNSVTSLGYSCFDSCTGLTSVVIPNSVTSIGYYCFYGCTGLTSITIPNSVTSLGSNCFRGCTGLNDYYLNWTSSSTIIEYNSGIMPNNTNTIFHIPIGTTQLYIDKGYPVDKLEEPSVITLTVTGSTFSSGNSTPFTYNDKVFVDWGDDTGLIEYTGGELSHTFNDGLNSHTVKVYGDITSISSGCFIFCQGLTSIVIPNSVISLESECFKECTDLISIDIPNSITSFGTNCFQRCTSLTSINIPNSVVSIGRYCFDGCTGLTSIQLNWTSNDILTYQSEWIENTNSNLKFQIPRDTIEAYAAKNFPIGKLQEDEPPIV